MSSKRGTGSHRAVQPPSVPTPLREEQALTRQSSLHPFPLLSERNRPSQGSPVSTSSHSSQRGTGPHMAVQSPPVPTPLREEQALTRQSSSHSSQRGTGSHRAVQSPPVPTPLREEQALTQQSSSHSSQRGTGSHRAVQSPPVPILYVADSPPVHLA